MEAALFIYFANVLPEVAILANSVAIGLGIFTPLFCVFGPLAIRDRVLDEKNFIKYRKILLIVLTVSAITGALIPNRTTIYTMGGAYLGQQMLTSDLAKDSYEIIKLEVKKVLDEKRKELENSSKIDSKEK